MQIRIFESGFYAFMTTKVHANRLTILAHFDVKKSKNTILVIYGQIELSERKIKATSVFSVHESTIDS